MGKDRRPMKCNITIRGMCEDESGMWFVIEDHNLLCRLDKKTGIIHQECSLPGINDGTFAPYAGMCIWNEYVVIAPWRGKAIVSIYHVGEKTLQEISLKHLVNDNVGKFSMCFAYKDYVYLMGFGYPAIVRINMHSFEPEYMTDWVAYLDGDGSRSTKFYLAYGEIIGNTAVVPFAEAPGILKVDLETGSTHAIAIPSSARGFAGLTCADGIYCLADRYENRIIFWESDTNALSEIRIVGEEEKQQRLFVDLVAVQEKVLLLPRKATHAYWVSLETKGIRKCMELEPHICNNQKRTNAKGAFCFLMAQLADGLYLDVRGDDCFYFYRFSDEQCLPIEKMCEKELADAVISAKYKRGAMESEREGLEELLQALAFDEMDFSKENRMKSKGIGEKIYRSLRG